MLAGLPEGTAEARRSRARHLPGGRIRFDESFGLRIFFRFLFCFLEAYCAARLAAVADHDVGIGSFDADRDARQMAEQVVDRCIKLVLSAGNRMHTCPVTGIYVVHAEDVGARVDVHAAGHDADFGWRSWSIAAVARVRGDHVSVVAL